MTLEELKNNNKDIPNINMDEHDIDMNNKIPSTEGNPIFDSSRSPVDRSVVSRTPTTDNLEESDVKVDKVINQVSVGPVDMNNMKEFDIDSLPRKRDSSDDMKDELESQLDLAISRKKDEIDEISDGAMKNLKAQFMENRDAKIIETNKTSDNFDFSNTTDYSPDSEVVYKHNDSSDNDDVNDESDTNLSIEGDNSNMNNEDNEVMIDTNSVTTDEENKVENTDDNDNKVEDVDSVVVEEQDATNETVSAVKSSVNDDIDNEKNIVEVTLDGFFDDSSELEEDINEEEINNNDYENRSDDEIIDEIKTSVKNVVKEKNIDISNFKISKNTVNSLDFGNDADVADWYLPNAQSIVTVKGLTGSEIVMLNPANSARNRINAFKDVYSTIYKHIIDPNKGTFEQWMKNTRYSDIQHIYFALYRATFYGSNFVHYQCPHCHRSFVKNNISFKDLVKFADDDIKVKCENAMKNKINKSIPYKINRVVISDEVVADIREPSVWNAIIEMTSLSDDFIDNHQELVNNVVAINKMYKIDNKNQLLIPISENPVDRNIPQTILNKIKAYNNVISNLSNDDYFKLKTEIANAIVDDNTIKYVTPECECEYCHTKIPETEMDASELLFTRHQLGALAAL